VKTLTRRSTTRPRPFYCAKCSTLTVFKTCLRLIQWHIRSHSLDHRSETRMARNVSFPIQRQKRTHWMPTQRQQQAKSTINNPASIFLGLWCWIRRFDITKHVCTTSHFRNFLMSKSKRDFLSERRNRSIIWARVQQRRFTGEIIVPKQLYFEKALICLCKTCGRSIRTYCVIFLQWNDVAEHTFREIDEWNFLSSQKGFVVRRNALGV